VIGILCGKFFRPVEREIEMTAPVIKLVYLSGWRFVVLQELFCRFIKGICQYNCFFIAEFLSQMLQRYCQGKKFSQRIPSEMSFLQKLIHVLWSRSSSPCFKESAAIH